MIVAAALAWWNEEPEDLARCVRGMTTVADRVVAVDGAYARYPGATITSPPDQAEAIRVTAQEVGLEAVIHEPKRLWAGQVEKRAYLLAEAVKGADWVAVVDADWRIRGDRHTTRAELDGLAPEIDVVKVIMDTPPGPSYASAWHRQTWARQINHVFRALPSLTCERVHWHYTARKDGAKVTLWGEIAGEPPPEPAHRLRARYRIAHLTNQRSEEQILASRAFLNDREWVMAQTGQEDDQPGLPPPKWDYASLAFET